VWGAVRDARWDLPLPFVVLGGIYSGYFAVSEAAAVTALYVMLVEVVILREVRWRDLPRIMRESTVLVGAILVILGVSLASTNYMIDAGVPQQMFALVSQYVSGPNTFLLVLLVFLLIIGAILDIFSATVLIVPLLLPVAAQFGMHPVHLGILFLAAMELGYLTPPHGLNLFIASHRFQKDITEIYWATQPFLLVSLLAVIIIAFWPGLSLMLLH
jgi:tripartite ATP-independent transporter DctM subunit